VRRIPVVVITGFLGAGKTTLLSQVIAEGALANTAILINEFGEVGIDHHLIREVRGNTVLLGGGCACCAVHGDFVRAMVELYSQAARGEGPRYDRVILETSGVSDPTTIVAALSQHRVLASAFELQAVVTVVDAVLGANTLRQHPEAAKQAALADRIVVSKCDAATAAVAAGWHGDGVRVLQRASLSSHRSFGAADGGAIGCISAHCRGSRGNDIGRCGMSKIAHDANGGKGDRGEAFADDAEVKSQ
jgi:G3E family GTPase